MKKHFVLFIMLFILASCEKGEEDTFVLNIDYFPNSNKKFLMITSPVNGKVLHKEIGTRFNKQIEFERDGNDVVDITFGAEDDFIPIFSIRTFRDVKSGFTLLHSHLCPSDILRNGSLKYAETELVIKGTKKIIEMINPYAVYEGFFDTIRVNSNLNSVSYDYDQGITTIKGWKGRTNAANQFTLRFLGEQEYKSIVIKNDDWTKDEKSSYKFEIGYDDLNDSEKHEIDLGISGNWIVNASILNEEENKVNIAYRHLIQSKPKESIYLYTQKGEKINELSLSLKNSSVFEGFHFYKNFKEIPSEISLKNYNIHVEKVASDSYEVSINDHFDVMETTYSYKNENTDLLSQWRIYQTSESKLSYDLPKYNFRVFGQF